MSHKVTLLAENLYIIRATWTHTDGRVEVYYYETPSIWTKAPVNATIFTSYDAGQGHLTMFHKRDKGKKGWGDGRTEVLDVVSLYHEILQSPNGTTIEVKKDDDA